MQVVQVEVDNKPMKALMFDIKEVPLNAWKQVWFQAIKKLFQQSQRPKYKHQTYYYSPYSTGTTYTSTNTTNSTYWNS